MAHVITAPCVGTRDRACQRACPVDCIVDAGEHLAIDPVRCVDCGACVSACPVSAIFPEDRVPTEWAAWTSRNRERSASLNR
ncbi:MAG: 4Fe-4S binding protein [Myxococcota bacterium]